MKYEIIKLPKNAYEVKITVPVVELNSLREEALKEMVKEVEVAGFRKGMAPRHLAEKQLDEGKIRGEVLNRAINAFYPQAVKEAHLSPIIFPRIEILENEPFHDLIFSAKICEKPEIKLGDYRKALSESVQKKVEKGLPGADGKPLEGGREGGIDEVLEAALSAGEVAVSDLLIDEEVNHMLSRLIDQTSRLGLTAEQYLRSVGKTVEQLKAEYRQTAEKNLKTEFLLYEISEKEGITVTEKEISDTINAAPDEKSREELGRVENRGYVKSVLLKNRVIKYLVKLCEGDTNDENKSSGE